MKFNPKERTQKYQFEIENIDKYTAYAFVSRYHYSPVMPVQTKHYLAIKLDGEIRGVLTLGWGTQPRNTFTKIFPGLKEEVSVKTGDKYAKHMSEYYFEIGKMCMDPDMPFNSETQMLAEVSRWIKKIYPRCLFLYTMADGIMGKHGMVYQAANFVYIDKFLTDVYMMDNGEKLHPRTSKDLCKENAVWLKENEPERFEKLKNKNQVFWLTDGFMKEKGIKRIKGYMFRYMLPLSKRARKMLTNPKIIDKKMIDQTPPSKDDLVWWDATDASQKVKLDEMPPFCLDLDNIVTNQRNIEKYSVSSNLEEFMA